MLSVATVGGLLLVASVAGAQTPPAPASTPEPLPTPTSAPAPGPGASSLAAGQHFKVDPVADGVLIAGGAGFSILLSMVLGTGDIQATPPGPTSNLLSIDRGAVGNHDPNAVTGANIGLYTAVGFAVLDPILSGFRDGTDALLVDAVMYAETVAITETLSDMTKIAVRRPRPIDYQNCENYPAGCTGTNFDLSFYSGHATTVAAIGATATYLAFQRDPHSARPWITLGLALALTTFVSYERVASGDHFPTDVVAGSMAGAAVGILVPHLHRHEQEAPPVWVGAAPTPGVGGGTLTLGGFF